VTSGTRPVKELKRLMRVALQPGEEQRVRLEVPVRDLGYSGLDMEYVVEQGAFKIWIVPDSSQRFEEGKSKPSYESSSARTLLFCTVWRCNDKMLS